MVCCSDSEAKFNQIIMKGNKRNELANHLSPTTPGLAVRLCKDGFNILAFSFFTLYRIR